MGLFFATLKIASKLRSLKTEIEEKENEIIIKLEGQATFFEIPKLAKTYNMHIDRKPLTIHVGNLRYIDHACQNLLKNWENSKTKIIRSNPS